MWINSQKRMWGSMDKKIYYHYCSVETFVSIMSTSTLRFGNPLNMNDSAEIIWLMEALRDFVEERKKYQHIVKNWRLIESMTREILTSLGGGIPYIACMSNDGDVLSQWRAYANDGRGVAIGFNTAYLDSQVNQMPVVYDRDAQKYIIEGKVHVKFLDELEGAAKNQNIEDIYQKTKKILSHLIQNALVCKNPAFQEEQEYRLILKGNQKEKFRVCDNRIVPYKELDFNGNKRFIEEIVIGPKCMACDTNMAQFIKSMGYQWWNKDKPWSPDDDIWKKHVRQSTATYR